jgi:Flp pilus assembly protein TadD
MFTSLLSVLRRNLTLSFAVGALALTGCTNSTGELITYANDARQQGLKQYEARDYENAAGSFRSATRQDPRDYKSFYYLGACYDATGSFQQAAQSYQASLKVMDVTLEGREDKAFRAKVIDGLAIAIAKGHDRTASITMPQPGKVPAEDAWLKAKVNRYTGDADAAIEAYNAASLQAPKDFYIAKDFGLYLESLGQTRQADLQLRRAYRMKSTDQEVAAALMRTGTVPGPAIKERKELAQPPIPQGPIPPVNEWKVPTFGNGSGGTQQQTGSSAAISPTPPSQPTAQAPRD